MDGYVTLTDDDTDLRVEVGDLLVFDPTGRDLTDCLIVGVVVNLTEGDRPDALSPVVIGNGGQVPIQVTRVKAVLS